MTSPVQWGTYFGKSLLGLLLVLEALSNIVHYSFIVVVYILVHYRLISNT